MRLALVTLLAVTLTACGVDERLADAYGLCDELHPDEPAFHADCRKFWEELLECTFDRRVELSVRKYTDYCGALADGSALVGHHDRTGGGANPSHWSTAHGSRGCGQANLQATGGNGFYYCFAVD